MDYTTFENYPLQILGIDDSYNSELNAISSFIESDIAYTGEVEDFEAILPYFVFFKFCENRRNEVSAMSGEQTKVSEFTLPSYDKQIAAWNYGAKKMYDLCFEKEQTVNADYVSQRTFI